MIDNIVLVLIACLIASCQGFSISQSKVLSRRIVRRRNDCTYTNLSNVHICGVISCDIVSAPVVEIAPLIKLHHIVVLRVSSVGGAFTIEFSPLNNTAPQVLIRMLIGRSVPGEIRVRYIAENGSPVTPESILDFYVTHDLKSEPKRNDQIRYNSSFYEYAYWCSVNENNTMIQQFLVPHSDTFIHHHVSSAAAQLRDEQLSGTTAIIDPHEINQIINHLYNNWDSRINLYVHNCQHFSKYVTKLVAV